MTDAAAGVNPRASDEVGREDVVGDRRPHRRVDNDLALVDIEVVADACAVPRSESVGEQHLAIREPLAVTGRQRRRGVAGKPCSRAPSSVWIRLPACSGASTAPTGHGSGHRTSPP